MDDNDFQGAEIYIDLLSSVLVCEMILSSVYTVLQY